MSETPLVPFRALRTVWFQIAGTICNLRCRHCFISCAPDNRTFGFISLEDFTRHLDQARRLGAGEFYFTGGEPFAHPDIYRILELSLEAGDTTVLTNGMLFRADGAEKLGRMQRASEHTLEVRLSIDGHNAEMNDAIRSPGVFAKATQGVQELLRAGLRPLVTISRTWEGPDCPAVAALREALTGIGYQEPRLKVLPLLRLGAEVRRTRPYSDGERVTPCMVAGFDFSKLVCSTSRLVTDRGVWVCPILPDAPEARMADTLDHALDPYPLRHQACYTCMQCGAICANPTVQDRPTDPAPAGPDGSPPKCPE